MKYEQLSTVVKATTNKFKSSISFLEGIKCGVSSCVGRRRPHLQSTPACELTLLTVTLSGVLAGVFQFHVHLLLLLRLELVEISAATDCVGMALLRLPYLFSSSTLNQSSLITCQTHPFSSVRAKKREVSRLYASSSGGKSDPYLMDSEERREWRDKIRRVLDKNPDLEEELDPSERSKKVQDLLANYPLVVDEDDPEWPDDADGRGFKMDNFFDKITIKNTPRKKNENDDDDDDSDDEIVWQDDNYIRPIKDVTTSEWEDTVFKDISPLVILVHNRYKRPKENERIRTELEKAVQIIWNCRLPSPRCVAIDAVTEHDLVSALQVSVYPELIFTKAGKILYREKEIRSGDELSKVMAFFYYGAAKPPCLNGIGDRQEEIPPIPINAQP